jgi:hypothetical protein
MYLPGLVGTGVLWLRACRDAEALYDAGDWFTLEGEPGVGKLALARAVHQRRNPAAPFHVQDAHSACSDWLVETRRELLEGKGLLVIRHVDRLNARQVHALSSALTEARAARRQQELRVAATLNRKQAAADLTRLLRFFTGTAELPPLRHHIEDLHELVPFFLAKLSQQGHLTCSPKAMQLLLRHNWPGNTEQLWQVLKQVVQRRRAGAIMPRDLPPECWTVSRRLLSPLESIERDAIVQSLQDHDGNKVRPRRWACRARRSTARSASTASSRPAAEPWPSATPASAAQRACSGAYGCPSTVWAGTRSPVPARAGQGPSSPERRRCQLTVFLHPVSGYSARRDRASW